MCAGVCDRERKEGGRKRERKREREREREKERERERDVITVKLGFVCLSCALG